MLGLKVKRSHIISSYPRSSHLRSSHQRTDTYLKKIVQSIRVQKLSLKELELNAKNRGIKGYKSMSIDKLLIILDASEPIKILKLSET